MVRFWLLLLVRAQHTLTPEQAMRNTIRSDLMFVRSSHPLAPFIFAIYDRVYELSTNQRALQRDPMDPVASEGEAPAVAHR